MLVLPILLAIEIPNLVKAREFAQTNACIQNLGQIDGAKQQWAIENKKKDTDTPTTEELKTLMYKNEFPVC